METIDILVVEDDASVLSLYKALFKFSSYSVKFVSTGEEALDLIKTFNFRVCILDINLHSNALTGVDLSIILKDNKKAEKIFAMTGMPFIFNDFDPAIAGFDQIFSKPEGFSPMVDAVRSHLEEYYKNEN